MSDLAHTTEVESFLLSILVSSPERAYFDAATLIGPEAFTSPAHRAIWRAIGRVCERAAPDPVLVWRELGEDAGLVEELGGRAYVHSLASLAVYPGSLREYARQIRDQSEQLRLRAYLQAALERPELRAVTLLEELHALSAEPAEGTTLRQSLEQLYLEAEAPTDRVVAYPWAPVQSLTGGIRPGWLCYLAGETSHGKTAAGLELSDSVLESGGRVLYVSLEMPGVDLALRIAQRYGASGGRLLHGRGTAEDFSVLSGLIAKEWTGRLRLEFVERVEQLHGLVLRHKPDLVVVDYLGLLDIGRETRLEGTGKNSRALKLLALRSHVPIVCLHQLSRARHEERNKLPHLSRLRDSGQLENDGDQVIFVWRKRDVNQMLLSEGAIMVAKARMGETGACRVRFDGATQRFDASFGAVLA